MLRTLRQPRYAALGVLMLVVALVCVACGVWQVYRFESKRDDNAHLRRNADRAATTVAAVLPLVGRGPAPSRDDVEYRQVRVTGSFDPSGETLVRNRTDGDDTGFLVLTPLRTAGATLLVVRGFVVQPSSGAIPTAPVPPAGRVSVTARTQSPETRNDQFAALNRRQVLSINPTQQRQRLGGAMYDGYAELEGGQPGTAGLRDLPAPDLSNPAGGALEPQHFAYVIQWFLFAALALAAPFTMARAETRRRDTGEFDDLPEEVEPVSTRDALEALGTATPTAADDVVAVRAAKLADRYGRPAR
ncbi:SURF1 family protein [Jatrophihabitans endophyticus]|uniref:SURF1 family protein n=1 Tax=Jatrophihabitans endophyticus TaxID=1206085 RepID=UPI0011612758|nr:SURF1 family protein [Jatrophihabitans endophyticus]